MVPSFRVFLECPHCGKVEYCDALRIIERLREIKMLRRNAEPDQATVAELVRQAADRFACVGCGSLGLRPCDEDPHEAAAWGDPVYCEVCQAVISSERLEVFPDSRLCTKCQSLDENGQTTDVPDYCSRCGDILQLKRRTGAGLAGYRSFCPTCGK